MVHVVETVPFSGVCIVTGENIDELDMHVDCILPSYWSKLNVEPTDP